MKLLADSPKSFDLGRALDVEVQGDYVYMYPPRQAYRHLPKTELTAEILSSLERTRPEPFNLYVHFPFCEQICKFCNLYAVVGSDRRLVDRYLHALESELEWWSEQLVTRRVDTIYLGGGTPSSLEPQDLHAVLALTDRMFHTDHFEVAEVSLEVAPDTVDRAKLSAFRDAGINRVNLGLQSADDEAIRTIGRRHGFDRARRSIIDSLEVGFTNVCVDLIYGLPGQSVAGWEASVAAVLEMGPHTICAYPLTRRPYTGFSKIGENFVVDSEQYRKYCVAAQMLADAGYLQETHVRYIRGAAGGYRQKANHWAGQDIVGVGAGARGYLGSIDYRNHYSVRNRRRALNGYLEEVEAEKRPYDSGFALSRDEQMRRCVILGLILLDRRVFKSRFGSDPFDVFPDEFGELRSLGLLDVSVDFIKLNPSGMKFRDLIVLKFFSEEVWKRCSDFDYSE